MGKLLPVILIVIGAAVGGGAGFVLKPAPLPICEDADQLDCQPPPEVAEAPEPPEEEKYYVSMKNQFVVPVIQNELVKALVVLSISVETNPNDNEIIFSMEPKLRDVFLQVLFDHSHVGGFDGAFTESNRLKVLKVALLEAAQAVVGPVITDVVITDIVRQEM